jgi:saccharopine dehydrogenase-like NADP-dependent oxidoreductase
MDVCDDINLSRIARSEKFQTLAKSKKTVALLSTGIWPGCSSLLAQKLIDENGGSANVDKVLFSFFTAGSGGAGPTILSATFLILGFIYLLFLLVSCSSYFIFSFLL